MLISTLKVLLLVCASLMTLHVKAAHELNYALLLGIQHKYGSDARLRVINWRNLINSNINSSTLNKLIQVNDFFNQSIEFVNDNINWRKDDYWATPLETLSTGAGDCEDYVIAKYFTLMQLGIDEKKLRITYVNANKLKQAHMVLTYFDNPSDVPLVLDNLINDIKSATERPDLLPVYSFNGAGLWITKDSIAGKRAGDIDRLSLWNEMKKHLLAHDLN